MVGCSLSERFQQLEQIEQERKINDAGFTYRYWDVTTIRHKLQPHPQLVHMYFENHEYWGRKICGPSLSSMALDSSRAEHVVSVSPTFVAEHVQLADFVSSETGRRLEAWREAWREGQRAVAREKIDRLRTGTVWSTLSPTTRAAVLRFDARLVLDETNDTARTQVLLDEARALVRSPEDARLAALVVYREEDLPRAADRLAACDDLDAHNHRAAILIEMGQLDEARAVLTRAAALGPHAETSRLIRQREIPV